MSVSEIQSVTIRVQLSGDGGWQNPLYPTPEYATHFARITPPVMNYTQDNGAMNSVVSKADLMPENMNALDFIASLARIFGFKFHLDENANRLALMTRNEYYSLDGSTARIEDWTELLDRSAEWRMEPVSWSFDKLTMTYADGGSREEADTLEKTGRPYGSFEVTTNNKGGGSEDFFKGLPFSNYASARPFSPFYQGLSNDVFRGKYELASFEEDFTKASKTGMALGFVRQAGNYASNGSVQALTVTDDNQFMLQSGRSWWSDTRYLAITPMTFCKTDSQMAADGGSVTFNFGTPEIFYGEAEDVGHGADMPIYRRYWGNYLRDRYSASAHRLTAHFYLLPKHIKDVLRKIIIVDGTTYVVEQVFDWDPSSGEMTRVQPIRVSNPRNYTSGQVIA